MNPEQQDFSNTEEEKQTPETEYNADMPTASYAEENPYQQDQEILNYGDGETSTENEQSEVQELGTANLTVTEDEESKWQASLEKEKKNIRGKALASMVIAAIPSATAAIDNYIDGDYNQQVENITQQQESVIQQENQEDGSKTLTIGAGGSITSTLQQFLESQGLDSHEAIQESIQMAADFASQNELQEGAFNLVHPGDSLEIQQNENGSWNMDNFSADNEWQIEPGYLPEAEGTENPSEPTPRTPTTDNEQNQKQEASQTQQSTPEQNTEDIAETDQAEQAEAEKAEQERLVQEQLENTAKAEKTVEQMHAKAKAVLDDMGTFAKIGLISEISDNANEIIAGNTDGMSDNLQKLMNTYNGALDKIENLDSEIYKIAKAEVVETIRFIETSSMGEIKARFS